MRSKIVPYLLYGLILLASLSYTHAREKLQGWCQDGGVQLTVPGTDGTTESAQQSFPSCTVTVYAAGTTVSSTIFSDVDGTSKANPFTADANGRWFFYADSGSYDVRFSGGGITTPFTLGDISTGFTTNVESHGAIGDGKGATDGAITASTAVFTSATASFVAADVGKTISIKGAGAAGAIFTTTINSADSGTQVTLAANASTTVSGASFMFGTDNAAALQAAFDAIPTVGGSIYIPTGVYLNNDTITSSTPSIHLIGEVGGTYNESIETVGWGTLILHVKASSIAFHLGPDAGPIVHSGPHIENMGFADYTTNTATMVQIENMNNWRVSNSHFRDSLVGINIVGDNNDASWGYVEHDSFRNNSTGVQSTLATGSFLAIGGRYVMNTDTQIGIHNKAHQTRIMGAKFDGGHAIKLEDPAIANMVIGNSIEAPILGVEVIGNLATTIEAHSIIGNNFSATGTTAISIDSSSTDVLVIGNRFGNGITNHLLDSGIATKTYDRSGAVYKTRETAGIDGQAGWDVVDMEALGKIPGMLVSLDRGIVLRDDPAIAGGMFLTADTANRAVIGAGMSGDIAGTPRARATSSSSIKFNGEAIEFYSNTGLTSDATFSPTLIFRIADDGLRLREIIPDGGVDFADGDTSPDISAGTSYYYRTVNTAPTTITTFDNPIRLGQIIVVRVNDSTVVGSLTTFEDESNGTGNLELLGNDDYLAGNGDIMMFVWGGDLWLQMALTQNSAYTQSTQNSLYLQGSGTPVSAVTPTSIRQFYLDTAANDWYVSHGTGITNWKKITP